MMRSLLTDFFQSRRGVELPPADAPERLPEVAEGVVYADAVRENRDNKRVAV
jgi:hypothetical protein